MLASSADRASQRGACAGVPYRRFTVTSRSGVIQRPRTRIDDLVRCADGDGEQVAQSCEARDLERGGQNDPAVGVWQFVRRG